MIVLCYDITEQRFMMFEGEIDDLLSFNQGLIDDELSGNSGELIIPPYILGEFESHSEASLYVKDRFKAELIFEN